MLREDDKKIFIFRESATLKGKPTKGRRTFVVIVPWAMTMSTSGWLGAAKKTSSTGGSAWPLRVAGR